MARAPINPATLAWARRIGHVTTEELARALGVKTDRVADFESGDAMPTFRQLTLLASKLDRSLGFFFAPPPQHTDVPDTADFRGRGYDELPANLVKEMRRAEQHRDAMLDLAGRPELRIRIGQIDWATAPVRAAELRSLFGLTDYFVPPESANSQVFNFWRGLIEEQGVLVFQTTRIPLDTFRGLSVYHADLPLIMVNGADSNTAKTFTLFHEIAHLANRTSGMCVLSQSVNEEAIANSFAASFLMPESAVRARVPDDVGDVLNASDVLARHFKVSALAAAVRLRTLGLIDEGELEVVRVDSDEKWARSRAAQKSREGFVPQWRLRYRDLGPNYIGTVARALEERRVDMVDATYLLNARVPMVDQLLEEYYRTGGAG
ncbi:XRE family transcriptional regulator [Rhodococcus sp. PvP104]|uniref:XRE family transcriptional regulator n=1 Tax=Rhodococcus sp. PvP104 TaxID=2817911 RepID=UPI001AE6217F|nr:XRE family transcriptional regulator [Rhodococcus sp. PvP104]MBP2527192.1 Zn-dependent peptidase ImmA (M78 family) [Rhodococcus sp. PvP104]